MHVRLELGGPMREEKGQWHSLVVPEGSTIREVLHRVGVTEELFIVVIRNSRRAELSDVVSEGDKLMAFPPVGGG
ncbi:MAG: MoaD/ThiS family protein [Conexivisphaerales archaeon]|jgi:molybdopterin converting factor small subunit